MVVSNRPITCSEILARHSRFFVDSKGDLNATFSSVASPESATIDSAVFLANPKVVAKGLQSAAGVVVVSKKVFSQVADTLQGKTLLAATNVELAMATVINEYFLKTPYTNAAVTGAHPTSIVSPEASVHPTARIAPFAFIGARAEIGAGAYIGTGAVIEDEVVIGESTVVHPQVFIGFGTRLGRRCEIHPQCVIGKEGYGYAHDELGNHYRIPHQGLVILEDDVHLGAGCTIDRGTFGETRIESGAKLDNQIHIAHNCQIGKNSLLTAGFMIAGSSRLGANFVAGGRSVVTGHVEICDNVQIGGLSGVTGNIEKPGQYAGFPLLPLQQALKMRAAMTHLPEMRKQVSQLVKSANLEAPAKDGANQEG